MTTNCEGEVVIKYNDEYKNGGVWQHVSFRYLCNHHPYTEVIVTQGPKSKHVLTHEEKLGAIERLITKHERNIDNG